MAVVRFFQNRQEAFNWLDSILEKEGTTYQAYFSENGQAVEFSLYRDETRERYLGNPEFVRRNYPQVVRELGI